MKKTPETQNKAKLEAAKAVLKAAEEALAAERVKLTEFERPYAKQSALVEGAETAVTNAEAQTGMKKQTVLEAVKAIAEGKSPVEPFDIVAVGKVCREAEAAGYLRTYHGCSPDWGGYKVTPEGHALLATR